MYVGAEGAEVWLTSANSYGREAYEINLFSTFLKCQGLPPRAKAHPASQLARKPSPVSLRQKKLLSQRYLPIMPAHQAAMSFPWSTMQVKL